MSVGGDIQEVTYNHPTIGNGAFYCKADEDTEADLGGYKNDDDTAGISGNGIVVLKKNRSRWEHSLGSVLWEELPVDAFERMQELSNSTVPAVWTIATVDGKIYKGTGWPVGEFKGNRNTGLITGAKLQGGGVLESVV